MRLKRAISIGAILWLSALVLGLIVVGITMEVSPHSTKTVTAGTISIALLSAVAAHWYFKDNKTRISANEGLIVGVIFVVVGSLLDLATFLLVISQGGSSEQILSYYASPLFVVGVLIVIVMATLIGHFEGGEHRGHNNPYK